MVVSDLNLNMNQICKLKMIREILDPPLMKICEFMTDNIDNKYCSTFCTVLTRQKQTYLYSLSGDSGSITIKKPTGSEIIAVDKVYDYNVPIEHM